VTVISEIDKMEGAIS